MKHLKLFILCVTMAMVHACKKPEACISASKNVVAVNEIDTLYSCSKDADRYFWTIDTFFVQLEYPLVLDNCAEFIVVKFPYAGEYEITLEAITYTGVKLNCNVGTGSESDKTSIRITVQ